jgi:hypothetical protein
MGLEGSVRHLFGDPTNRVPNENSWLFLEMNDGMIFVERCYDHMAKHAISAKASRQNIKMPHAVEQGRIRVSEATAGGGAFLGWRACRQ